jgi:oxygen-independent coproporphyrinogen-3 oxidase
MEIDPRTVHEDQGQKLALLRKLGFNRVSFGVQDTNQDVQEAIRRRQSYEMTLETYQRARQLGFEGINIDLIYGLPHQSVETFSDTIVKIIAMRPDRIALFSYARVPWLKGHQKAIPDAALPSTEEKFRIYLHARQELLKAGYVAIGMDHFALPQDSMAHAFYAGQLHRNFQGYTVNPAEDMLGFGVTAIGHCRDAYVQNLKDLDAYYASLDTERLPVHRGKVLSETDRLRRWVVNKLMCQFELDKGLFEQMYGVCFKRYFAAEQPLIQQAVADGLCTDDTHHLRATPVGRLFIRNVASIFDWYLQGQGGTGQYSKGV